MLLPCFIFVISGDTLYHGVKVTSVRIMCIFLVNVSMNCWCLMEPSSAFMVIVWDNLVWVHTDFEECFVALRMISVRFPLENYFELHIDDSIYCFNYVIFVESVSTCESMIPRPCFQALHTVSFQFCYMFACSDTYFRLNLLLIIITTTCVSLSLRRTSAPIHLTSDEDIPTTQPSPPTVDDPIVADQDKSNGKIRIGPITRARAKLLQ
jgi:hypothetical protein